MNNITAAALSIAIAFTFALPARSQTESLERSSRMRAAQNSVAQSIQGGSSVASAARSAPRIINGDPIAPETPPAEWSYTVSLQRKASDGTWFHDCGGALVHPVVDVLRHLDGSPKLDDEGRPYSVFYGWQAGPTRPEMVITAAHCVTDGVLLEALQEDSLSVIVGEIDLSGADNMSISRVAVREVLPHPGYSYELDNDIAVLIIDPLPPAIDSSRVHGIAMPTIREAREYMRPTAALSVNGWGRTEDGSISDVLLTVRMPFSDQQVCRESYQYLASSVRPGSFCAGFVSGAYDSCQGDSGGPIVYRPSSRGGSRLGKPILTGTVSWGRGCAEAEFPGVYTSVLYHVDWLERISRDCLGYLIRDSVGLEELMERRCGYL